MKCYSLGRPISGAIFNFLYSYFQLWSSWLNIECFSISLRKGLTEEEDKELFLKLTKHGVSAYPRERPKKIKKSNSSLIVLFLST